MRTQNLLYYTHKNAKKCTQKFTQKMQKMHTEIAKITQKMPNMIYRG
jgi:hypothetical protein